MITEVFPTPELTYTLPDAYFEERMNASAEEIEAVQDEELPKAFAYAF